ncbi:MAG: HNH endonuclease [Patescibacteria group bacterium]
MSIGYFDIRITKRTKTKINFCESRNWRCCYCKYIVEVSERVDVQQYATFDHVIPQCYGGDFNFENIVIACKLCNYLRQNSNHLLFEKVIADVLTNQVIRDLWHTFSEEEVKLLYQEVWDTELMLHPKNQLPTRARFREQLALQRKKRLTVLSSIILKRQGQV